MLYWRAPNTEAGENTAYNNVRVGRPQHREMEHQFQQAMQVGGAQHREIGTPISTGKLGRDRNKFCENIIFVLLLYHFCSNPVMLKF